jgi:hypothetical protein
MSRQDIRVFLPLNETAVTADLRQQVADSRLPALVDRVHELYHKMEDPDPCLNLVQYWLLPQIH